MTVNVVVMALIMIALYQYYTTIHNKYIILIIMKYEIWNTYYNTIVMLKTNC